MILPEHKIYLHKSLIFPRNIEDFVSFLFLENFPETYYDIESRQIQCRKEKNRSFTDLVRLCHTYFPHFSLEKLKKIVLLVCMENITYMPWYGFIFCRDIKKIVIYISHPGNENWCWFSLFLKDALAVDNSSNTIDGLTWFNLQNILYE